MKIFVGLVALSFCYMAAALAADLSPSATPAISQSTTINGDANNNSGFIGNNSGTVNLANTGRKLTVEQIAAVRNDIKSSPSTIVCFAYIPTNPEVVRYAKLLEEIFDNLPNVTVRKDLPSVVGNSSPLVSEGIFILVPNLNDVPKLAYDLKQSFEKNDIQFKVAEYPKLKDGDFSIAIGPEPLKN